MEALRKPRLRVGVFAASPVQPRWIVEALARAGATDFAEITVVVTPRIGDRPRFSDAGIRGLSPVSAAPPMVWRAYERVDQALFGSRMGWSKPEDLTALVGRERRVTTDEGCWRARVREARLDVAFAVGEVSDAELEGFARHGVWRFCFGEEQGTCESLAGVREVIDARQVVASGIRIHLGGDRPDRLAYQSWARAFPFSVARSRDQLFAKTSEFLARSLRDLHDTGPRWIELGTEPARPAPPESFPGLGQLLSDIPKLGFRVVERARQKALTLDQWSLAFRFTTDETFNGSLDGFFKLEPPKGWYWADPFPIQVNGRHYIFFEELPRGASKGHISVVEVDREGRASRPVKVLERDYHLSYPFLIQEDGRLYMIPETASNRTVEIYRCVDFPSKWKLERVLMRDVCCADATVHREGERWFMFANAARPGRDINDELHLFTAEALLGDWKPHRRNPVKSDVRSARPAGRLFRRGGRLYRPGQIGTPLYGAGIALHRVTRLTPDEFREEEDRRIYPADAGTLGLHTWNRAGDLTVTDAFERRPRF